ncbi:hypothetical protein BDZ94DRAFT_1263033 [Collybia nuda]|uniref:Uncharacterized protein n=1 Tax=Collybia nuda TaxID=64659 RepID=A0A9P5Y5S5_9AGAR|nr:hypothetical protein BDZ94DRAFT_1263033 [Collybia nuda]
MSLPTIHTMLIGPHPVPIIDPGICEIFSSIPDQQQQFLISEIQSFIEQVELDGSIMHLLRLGVLTPETMNEKYRKKDLLLTMAYWQLTQFYRYSTPSRISEAVPALRVVISIHKRLNPSNRTIPLVPLAHLGVALSRSRKHDDEALEILRKVLSRPYNAFDSFEKILLWPRAELSRLLRRFGRTAEAKKHEDLLRSWMLDHSDTVTFDEFDTLVSDDTDSGINYILAHEDMRDFFNAEPNMNSLLSQF